MTIKLNINGNVLYKHFYGAKSIRNAFLDIIKVKANGYYISFKYKNKKFIFNSKEIKLITNFILEIEYANLKYEGVDDYNIKNKDLIKLIDIKEITNDNLYNGVFKNGKF